MIGKMEKYSFLQYNIYGMIILLKQLGCFHFQEIPLGKWEFRSKSSQDDLCGMEGGCRGYMFALEVTEELETWPEQKNRARQWVIISNKFLEELHNSNHQY